MSGFVETLVANKIHPLKKEEKENEQQKKMNKDGKVKESKEKDDHIAFRSNESLDFGHCICPKEKQHKNQALRGASIISQKQLIKKVYGGKSTPKKKDLILERINTSTVADTEPDVQIVSFSIVCPGRPEIVLSHPFISSPKACLFTLKEGTKYRLKFSILVSNKSVSGLKYENTLWKACVRVDRSTVMLGSFVPRKNPYIYQLQEETLPTGMLVRGVYTARAKVIDGDGKCHMDISYHFGIQKSWPSTS